MDRSHRGNDARHLRSDCMTMKKIVLLRHGESVWNQENRFTGWTDVGLTAKGVAEAGSAAALLQREGLDFDVAFASVLKRAIKTLWIVLEEMDRMWIPVQKSWRLNERHYGALQGLNKAETAARFGEAQVKIWRRSYDTPPPPLRAQPGDDLELLLARGWELPADFGEAFLIFLGQRTSAGVGRTFASLAVVGTHDLNAKAATHRAVSTSTCAARPGHS